MLGHKDSSGKFHPHSDSSKKLSSHQVEDSKQSSVNKEDYGILKGDKSSHLTHNGEKIPYEIFNARKSVVLNEKEAITNAVNKKMDKVEDNIAKINAIIRKTKKSIKEIEDENWRF